MSTTPSAAPRSLADALRGWDDARLARLLQARPDLAVPVPPDLGVLAARAGVRLSVLRCLEGLDAWRLAALEALSLSVDPVPHEELPDAETARQLADLALVWDDGELVHVVSPVRDVLVAGTGTGRPLATLLAHHTGKRLAATEELLGAKGVDGVTDAVLAQLPGLLEEAGEQGRAVLHQLASGGARGTVRDARRVPEATDEAPVRWLLAHGLLVAIDDETVELPREVGLVLTGADPLAGVSRTRPDLVLTTAGRAGVDDAAAQAAAEALRRVEALLSSWSEQPPGVLRSGGLGVRDLKRVAKDLDVADGEAALLIETAYAAGLLDMSAAVDPDWLPTPAFDRWESSPPEERWLLLARTWVGMSRQPGLVGLRDDRDKPVAPLSTDVSRPAAAVDRRRVLDVLLDAPKGASVDRDSVIAVLDWLGPRRGGRLRGAVPLWVLNEAAVLGITGRDGLSTWGRSLVRGEDKDAGRALADALPAPVDHVLVQPDLTVIAPGPLERDLAHEMSLVADVESTGGATVFRVTDATVRRALDAGRSAGDLHELFRSRSRTPVPQSLTYLIDDLSRRHGRLRVGTSASYLRCDDEALLTELLAVKKAAPLRLRRLAPTVLTAQAPVDQVLEVLRAAGYAPVAEAPDGAVLIARPEARRTQGRPRSARYTEPTPLAERQAALAVTALRAGDLAARAQREPVSISRSSDVFAFLQDAAREHKQVWLGYVDAQGSSTQRVVEPRSVEGGFVRAYDHLRDEDRTFAVHRITGVADVES